jgi:hypothetical protein
VQNAFPIKNVFVIIIWPAPLDRDRCHFMCQAQHSEPIVTADARPRRADPGRVRGLECPGSLHLCGDQVATAHWFERNRGACGPAALYTEEYDVR